MMIDLRAMPACAFVVFLTTSANPSLGASRIHSGLLDWRAAAQTGRADLLIFGDSIVSNGNGGFSNGIAEAAKSGMGMAGSGLLAAPSDHPAAWSPYTGARLFAGPASPGGADGLSQQLTPSGRYYDARTDFALVETGYDPLEIDRTAPIDWHIFAAGTSSTSQLQAMRMKRMLSPVSVTATHVSPIVPVAQQSQGLTNYIVPFAATSNVGDWTSFELTANSRDVDIYYTKLINPNATGITVTGWSESGGSAGTFRNTYYNSPVFTEAGRDAFYGALVAGNSGYLNVMMTFGVNDAARDEPSVYRANIEGLIADVRRDWAAAGHDPAKLSFTLMSTYQINPNTYFQVEAYPNLLQLRPTLDAIAATDSQISFIDLWEAGPAYAEAKALGYLPDGVHPSASGTLAYGTLIERQLAATAGDANFDGAVDFDDLLTLAQHYGQADADHWQLGNFDGEIGVNFDDLLLLAQNYGLNANVSANAFAADWALARSIVPEPTSLVSAGVGAMLVSRRRRT